MSAAARDRPLCFDAAAASFDRRSGIPPAAAEAIARALALRTFGAERPAGSEARGWLLELGAGTGTIGRPLAAAAAAAGRRYLGVDLSLAMLAGFRSAVSRASHAPSRAVLDAERPWPVAAASVEVAFLSRTAHLLARDHLLAELARTGGAGGGDHGGGSWLALGRVRRPAGSLRERLRSELRHRLAERGVAGRRGGGAHRALAALLDPAGEHTTRAVVARWPVETSVAAALEAWRHTPGLAGRDVPAPVRAEVLDALSAWARRELGDPARSETTLSEYELTVIYRTATPDSTNLAARE